MVQNDGFATMCHICGGPLATFYPYVRDPQTGEAFRIERCERCGLGQTLPQPLNLADYYGVHYHGGRHGVTDRMCMARRIRFVSRIAAPGRLLDFGCGDGGFLARARTAGFDVVGVETN